MSLLNVLSPSASYQSSRTLPFPIRQKSLQPIHLSNLSTHPTKPKQPSQSIKMVSFTIVPAVALALLAAFTSAAPARSSVSEGDTSISVTFIGAAGAEYSQSVPFDFTVHPTNNALSISKVRISGGPCLFYGPGDDFAAFSNEVAGTYDIGPPQIIEGVACGHPGSSMK